MNKSLGLIILTSFTLISTPSLDAFWGETPQSKSRREQNEINREQNRTFFDRMIDEALVEEKENLKVIDDYAGEKFFNKILVPINENDEEWSQKITIQLSKDSKKIESISDIEKVSKRLCRTEIIDFFNKRNKYMKEFHFEPIQITKNEFVVYAEGISEEDESFGCCVLIRVVGHDYWNSFQIIVSEKSSLPKDKKEKWLARFSGNKAINHWKERCKEHQYGAKQ